MLLLVEGEEKESKFGVLIFILAHEIKQIYSLSWKHCNCSIPIAQHVNSHKIYENSHVGQ